MSDKQAARFYSLRKFCVCLMTILAVRINSKMLQKFSTSVFFHDDLFDIQHCG